MTTFIKPCPFCGKTDIAFYTGESMGHLIDAWAQCKICRARSKEVRITHEVWNGTTWHEDALKEWNTRYTGIKPLDIESIKRFVTMVNEKAERNMAHAGVVSGAHWNAMKSVLREIEDGESAAAK